MGIQHDITALARKAKDAYFKACGVSADEKNMVLREIAASLRKNCAAIISANKKDLANAKKAGIVAAMADRLALDAKRVGQMADSVDEIAALPDPVNEVMKAWRRPNGLWIHKVRVPIGVIAIIYEARPNVTSDCAALCFKAGNSVILRGGSEAYNSNMAVFSLISRVMDRAGMPSGMVSMVPTTDRAAVSDLLKLSELIDLVIPRGGEELIRTVTNLSRIPVIKHYKGICHVFVDEWADLNMAQEICFNAKVQRPGVCNAMESMLVHTDCAQRFLPGMLKKLGEAGVEIRGCPVTRRIFKKAKKATEADYRTEYLDLKLSVKVVASLDEAICHVNTYGSHHSDSIVTENYDNALRFLRSVDSACVYVNASTRFTDGNQFGMGAEIGISTDKLHARGPMALEELTTYKYMIFGNGQVRK